MFDAIIGMTTGIAFVILFVAIPISLLLYNIAEMWVETVTNYEVKISQKPYNLFEKYYNDFFRGCVFIGWGIFLLFGTIIFLTMKYDTGEFTGTYLDYCIMVLFEVPAKAGSWASEVILVVLVYFVSTWAAKWVYGLSSRISKLEKSK